MENSNYSFNYKVNAVPTVVAMKDGQAVDRFVGLLDDDKIRAFVGKLLNE